MSDRFETPTDDLSGLPLPLYTPPIDQLEPHMWTNRHHTEHPAAELRDGLSSEAVRHVRVEETLVGVHRLYHAWFDGPPLPASQREKYDLVVFAAAGLIPRQAIAFDDEDEPYLTDLSSEERHALWDTNTIHIEAPDVVRDFLLQYTLRHGKGAVAEITVDEFLHTADPVRRKELGRQLLLAAAEVVAEPLQERYSQAQNEQLIVPGRARQVGQFVCDLLTLSPNGIVRRRAIDRLVPHLLR